MWLCDDLWVLDSHWNPLCTASDHPGLACLIFSLGCGESSMQDLASFPQVQPGLRPMPCALTSCPWACLESPGRSHRGNLLTTHVCATWKCKGVNTSWVESLINCGWGEVWAGGYSLPSCFSWVGNGETFMQLSRQSPRTEPPVTYSHDQVVEHLWPGCPLSLLHAPVTHPPWIKPPICLSLWQTQFKTELITNF